MRAFSTGLLGTFRPNHYCRIAWLATSAVSASFSAVAADSVERDSLEGVVVTAQKREERLQDVPISISVVTGDVLDSSTVSGITETLNRIPGVTSSLAVQGSGTQMVMRGVTSGSPLGTSSPVAYYMDSVPFGLVKASIVPDPNVYDLERVEVLRGPQGTLYGASAQNGVVRVLTNDANLNEYELKVRTSLSSTQDGDESYRGDVALNVPIVPGKLGFRAVGGYQDLGGWVDTPAKENVNGATLRNSRLKVNAQPTEKLSIGLSAWLSRSDYGAPSAADENQRRSSVADESIVTDYDAFGLKIGYDFHGFTASSMTSYVDYSNAAALDLLPYIGAAATLFTGHNSKIKSEEILFNSTHAGPWRWSVGAMYREGEERLLQTSVLFAVPVDYTDTSESYALFGELTRAFGDGKFELTGGLRYFNDRVGQDENIPQSGVLTDTLIRSRGEFTKTSPRVVLTWHASDDMTFYTSYSEGFRSGADQNANIIRTAPQFPDLKPDNLKNYEVGIKGNSNGGRFGYDAAVYFIDWQDVQQGIAVPINGIPFGVYVNTGSASGMGFEFALNVQPLDGLHLSANFSWNDLTADSAVVDEASGANLYDKGERLNYSAEYTAGASAEYEFPLGSAGFDARFAISANYTSEQVFRSIVAGVRSTDVGSSMTIGRASFSVDAMERWTATLFVDNVNNESSPGVGLFHVEDWRQRVRPRTYGAQLEYRF